MRPPLDGGLFRSDKDVSLNALARDGLMRTFYMAASGLACLMLAGCGGEGNGATAPVVASPPPASSVPPVPTFQANNYPASSTLKSVCETVRTDTDPQGNPRDDLQGELAHELFWIRSFMDETYLFYDQVTDQNPNNFSDRDAYFEERLTTATTATGRRVDRFSFIQSTEDYEATSSGAPTFGYGANFARLRTNTLPRDWRVAFTQEGSNAQTAGFTRGAHILTIDGVDFVNATSTPDIDVIVEGLFPTAVGEDHIFGVRFPDGTETDITVQSQSIAIEPVNAVETINHNGRDFGYVHFHTFSPRTGEAQLRDAFTQLAQSGVDDLILDFRYNGGGLLAIAAQIGFMTAGPISEGRTFYRQEFNSRAPGRNPISGETVSPIPFLSETVGFSVEAGEDLPSLDLPRVFVLTTSQSCSASEAVMNGLIGIGVEVIQIGGRTCGKPTGQIPVENCGITYVPLHFRGVNANGFGDFSDGFAPGEMTGSAGPIIPGCDVSDDFSAALGDPGEGLLAAALTYAETGQCPAPPSSAKASDDPWLAQSSVFGLEDPLMDTPRMRSIIANETLLEFDKTGSE